MIIFTPIGGVQQFIVKNGRVVKKIRQPCAECGKERWVLLFQWNQGKCRICHHCYVMNHSLIAQQGVHFQIKGKDNPHWTGGKRTTKDGYVMVFIESNSPFISMRPQRDPYVLEHRLVMAQKLGRCLLRDEVVHHLNGVRTDNRPENLALVNSSNHERHTLEKLLQVRIRELEQIDVSRSV